MRQQILGEVFAAAPILQHLNLPGATNQAGTGLGQGWDRAGTVGSDVAPASKGSSICSATAGQGPFCSQIQ